MGPLPVPLYSEIWESGTATLIYGTATKVGPSVFWDRYNFCREQFDDFRDRSHFYRERPNSHYATIPTHSRIGRRGDQFTTPQYQSARVLAAAGTSSPRGSQQHERKSGAPEARRIFASPSPAYHATIPIHLRIGRRRDQFTTPQYQSARVLAAVKTSSPRGSQQHERKSGAPGARRIFASPSPA